MLNHSQLKAFTQANRAAWNEVMPLHQRAAREKWDRAFMQAGYTCLDETAPDLLRRIGIASKAVAHLCCNNGIELLSIKNLGAGECIGFDISDEVIREAQERAALCQIACCYVHTDVYDISTEYANRFDLVYISAACDGSPSRANHRT